MTLLLLLALAGALVVAGVCVLTLLWAFGETERPADPDPFGGEGR